MWPLTTREVIEGCAGATAGRHTGATAGRHAEATAGRGGGEVVGGATGSLVDLEEGDLFVALPFVNGDAHGCVAQALSFGARLALVADTWDGLPELAPLLRERCVVVPDVVFAFRRLAATFRARLSCPVIAVAGSNGKTTTKEMLAAMLSSPGQKVVRTPGTDNGFLGLPRTLCARELRTAEPADALVLEIGIDAPLAMAQHARMAAPDITVITALGPEHLEGFGDVATAVREELSLLEHVPGARRVLSLDDPEIAARPWLWRRGDVAVVEGGLASRVTPAADRGVSVLVFRVSSRGGESTVDVSFTAAEGGRAEGPGGVPPFEIVCPLPGRHNARNLALAAAAALALGRSPEEVREGWRTFDAPEGRSRLVPLSRGALLYDDTFNASPLSMAAALDSLRDPVWAARPKLVVLGDMLDLGRESAEWHIALAEQLSGMQGVRVWLFGREMGAVARRLRTSGDGAELVGHQDEGDPSALVDGLDLPEGSVVLVKGSRGMRMERAARHLSRRWAKSDVRKALRGPSTDGAGAAKVAVVGPERGTGRAAGAPEDGTARRSIVIVGVGREEMADALVAALSARGEASFAVEALRHDDILRTAIEYERSGDAGRAAALVVAGIDMNDLPPGVDAETHLAHVAQLLVRGCPPGVLLIPDKNAACGLLAEVAPPATRVVRYGGPVEGREVLSGGVGHPGEEDGSAVGKVGVSPCARDERLRAAAVIQVMLELGLPLSPT